MRKARTLCWCWYGPNAVGGAEGIRTPDLLIANETRYQLRHSPGCVSRTDAPAVVSGLDDTSSLSVEFLASASTAPAAELWDPVPVTLPTYVSKPRATRSVRTIDLRADGVSSSGRDAAASALVASAASDAAPDEPEHRAVGS